MAKRSTAEQKAMVKQKAGVDDVCFAGFSSESMGFYQEG